MPHALIAFLAILNPFALCLYLAGPAEDLTRGQLARAMAGACGIALGVFVLFALAGEPLLTRWLSVRPAALRAFGGVIFLIVAYQYVVRGYRAAEVLRGSLAELPSAIAMPFMIGAGTLTQAILIGRSHSALAAVGVLAAGVAIAFGIVLGFKIARDRMVARRERVFERYVNILARVNGLLIGAISTEMVVTGIRELWATA